MRLLIVLPKRRLWLWHLALAARLRAGGAEVSVALDGGASPYSPLLRTYLRLERRWFAEARLARPAKPDPSWAPFDGRGPEPGGLLVNLSERPLDLTGTLELRFDGALGSDALIATLLERGQPTLTVGRTDEEIVLAASRPAVEDKLVLLRGLEQCFSRAVSLVGRAVRHAGAVPPLNVAATSPALPRPTRPWAVPTFAGRSLIAKGTAKALRPVRHPDHWRIALRLADGPFRVIDDDGERYFADPFLTEWDGRPILFVEEFDHAVGRGHLAAAEIRGDRLAAAPVPVLRRPYHLSYPLVFTVGPDRYMVPESGANRTVDLYRAEGGPWAWTKVATLLDGRVFADPTPLHHRGLWWLFVTADDGGEATQDELQLYVSDRLCGPYAPHPMNPIRSDCRFARPAGRIRAVGGRLLRPAQDCEAAYGAGIAWFVIDELTPTSYRETLLTVWNGSLHFGCRGFHSFDQLGDLQAIDLNGPRWRGRLRTRGGFAHPADGFDTSFLSTARD